MGRTHAASGLVLSLAAVPYLQQQGVDTTPLSIAWLGVAGAGAAMLNDFDHRHATVAHSLGPISKGMAIGIETISGGHRNGTHSIIGVAAFTGFALGVNQALPILRYFHVDGAGTWAKVVMALWIAFLFAVASAAFHLEATKVKAAHAVLCLIGAAAIVTLSLYFPLPFDILPYGVLIGTVAHILGDMLTKQGCPLLWPFSKFRFKVANFTTDQFFEHYILWPVLLLIGAVQMGFLLGAGPFLTSTGKFLGEFFLSLAR